MEPQIIGVLVAVVLVAFAIGYMIRKYLAEAKIISAETEAKKIKEEAVLFAEATRRESVLEAKEEVLKLRNEVEKENKERRSELQRLERRLVQKEETLDRKVEGIERKEEALNRKEQEIEDVKNRLKEMQNRKIAELERVSGMTSEEARQLLLSNLEKEIQHEEVVMIREMENRIKEESDKRARDIISLAIQRSGFDPIRREAARIALEKLIVDGRIHPARIEEMVDRAQKEIEVQVREAGEQASFQTGVHGLHPEMVNLLGRLKYRTSYGQNVLKHSVEVAHLGGLIAAELGVDIQLTKRAGLLHDIGKAMDHMVEGPHVTIGVELAKKYQEHPEIVHAIAAHHGDEEPKTIIAVLIQTADAISAARPGARRETLEAYLKRLQKLEEIANSFEGVDKSYAIQAGREIRIMVKPEKVDDLGSVHLARGIAKKIENEVEYPGQIKVTILREIRVMEYAK
ncbi:MAG: Ribonuclease Y [Desulfotomaculum sp. 46_296]|nr:MAG: Ribonuclease Y [Desulfotomaculum sp. 46_296]